MSRVLNWPKSLNWYWRLGATGFAYALFGLGGVILSVTVFPLMLVLIRNQDQRWRAAQGTISRSFRLFLWTLDALGVAAARVENVAQLRAARGMLITPNHPTLLDVVHILSWVDSCQCVIKAALFSNPFLAGVVRAAGYIRNDGDPERLIADCATHLRAGANIVIFPEGTRTPSGEALGRFQRGMATIALNAPADLIPVLVYCNHDTLKKGVPWYRIPASKIRYRFQVHPPWRVADFLDPAVPRARQTRALTQAFEGYIQETLVHDIAGNGA
ncbi:MAG: 1-acyl-sn-glycerol-3-phosphate acyltransferase [Rhodospirillum sp.]|nr:1-acyl-sn-glycerol-3-phosphate acyltransferase [Rhodospirillum sp.]MCF8490836.1 1-acyl-sn-glycerol-3-phosphate acyltransferase [Rhodospirillum sp.]MCF8501395.1 1-acyl-sn-glycerol-3-phosphate acyltransferase [Rhodospirillum sp.]